MQRNLCAKSADYQAGTASRSINISKTLQLLLNTIAQFHHPFRSMFCAVVLWKWISKSAYRIWVSILENQQSAI